MLDPNVNWTYASTSGECEKKGCPVHTFMWLAITVGSITKEGHVCHKCRDEFIIGVQTATEIKFVFYELNSSTVRAIDPSRIDGLQLRSLGEKLKL